jgi:hypothetical protein
MSYLQQIGCGVTVYVAQQGEFPDHPEGQWYGQIDSGAVLSFVPNEDALVSCIFNIQTRTVNLPVVYFDIDKNHNTNALVQVDHDTLTVDRMDPNVNDELLDQVAIDNAFRSLFSVLLPTYVYRGNLIGLQ